MEVFVKEQKPDTARRHASLFLQNLSYAFTNDTRGSLDTPDLRPEAQFQHKTTTCGAVESRAERGVKGTEDNLVMHANRLNMYASVCEEVRNTMLTRSTLMNTAQPMDIGALDKGKGKEKGQGQEG